MDSGKRAKLDWEGSEEGEISPSSSSLDQSQSQNQGQTETELGQGSNVNELTLNDLPPEMWLEILKCVDTRSLFKCRLVNRQWNGISIGILHQRSDSKISFTITIKQEQFYQQRRNINYINNFLMRINESENCPFARFAFIFCEDKPSSTVYSNFFNHEDWTRFLSMVDESHQNQNQNQRVKIKSLEMEFREFLSPFEPLMEHLRDLLLLNKIPHLEELGLNILSICDREEMDKEVKLFPNTVETPNPMVQLPHLKTIRFNQSMIEEIPGIVTNLLKAAVNLKKIYLYESGHFYPTPVYDFLEPLGKFHLIKTVEFRVDHEFLSQVTERPDFTRALYKLELEGLKIDMYHGLDEEADRSYATDFFSNLFECSKNSLRELTTNPLDIFHRVQFPTFKNLTKLKLMKPAGIPRMFFSPGVRSQNIFPAVRELDLPEWSWSAAFPQLDSIPVFPRVLNLSVTDSKFTPDSIRVLSLLCPNLKHLKLHRDKRDEWISPRWSPSLYELFELNTSSNSAPKVNFLPVGRQIWTLMNQLESLEIDVDVDSLESNPFALDSCFTGISEKNCKSLYKLMEAKNTLENGGSQTKVLEPELKAEREHPSILDMTNLKWLKINAYEWGRVMRREDFFREKLTWISEDYAFKFMPHLKLKPCLSLSRRDLMISRFNFSPCI